KAGHGRPPAFFALDRPRKDTVPIHEVSLPGGGWRLAAGAPAGGESEPLFHALPADAKGPPATAGPLYEVLHPDGRARVYSPADSRPGYRRAERPVCLVWRNPMTTVVPLE